MNRIKREAIKPETFRMLHTDPTLYEAMSKNIISWLPRNSREYVVVCVGTDRSTGDSLGPLTGTFFSKVKPKHMTVYGSLHKPVHAKNLNEYIDIIKSRHNNPYIIAIDACLGRTSSIGHIISGTGPLKPGAALNKQLPSIGDIHITGVVNMGGFMEYSILQNTRLSIVVDMANCIAIILDLIDQQLVANYTSPAILMPSPEQTIIQDYTR